MYKNIELYIIKYILNYNNYIKYRNIINIKYIKEYNNTIYNIYYTLDNLMKELSRDISLEELHMAVLSSSPEKIHNELNEVFNIIGSLNIQDDAIESCLDKLALKEKYNKLALAAYEASEGRGNDQIVTQLIAELNAPTKALGASLKEVKGSLKELLEKQVLIYGLRWRLKCLNLSLGSLRVGDFGFTFARPETGKTSFLADQATFMAEQSDKPILWFNNEEQGEKVKLRCYSAALGATLSDIIKHPDRAEEAFNEKTGGRIRIFDEAKISKNQVESILKETPCSLVIFDQIDKIEGFKADREDLLLGEIYNWARSLAKMVSPIMAVCQADGTGEGQRWLSMANVANAKTAKQAEADWILGIGKDSNPDFDSLRFLNISKNKLVGDQDSDPKYKHGRFEVIFKPEISRYEDL